MKPKLAAAAAILFAASACLTGRVMAGGSGNNGAPVSTVSAEEIPAYLKPVSLDLQASADLSAQSPLTIDIPLNGTIYPPDIIPPQIVWRDNAAAATVWQIEITFGEHRRSIKFGSNCDKMQLSPVDATLVGYVPPTLTQEQAVAHTWRPEAKI